MPRVLWRAARDLERTGEDRRVGLGSADLGGGERAVEQLAQARALELLVQRDVPVRGRDERHSSLAQYAQGRRRVGERLEADCAEEHLGQRGEVEVRPERVAQHLRAAT